MKKLNEFIFQKRLKKHIQRNLRKKRFVDYDHAKTVLLFFESDYVEKNRFIHKAIEQLKADGKKVYAWGLLENKNTSSAILPYFKILDKGQIDFFGSPQKSFIKELTENEYDLLIDLTLEEKLPMKYLKMYANASLKAGISDSMNDVMDFIIHIPVEENQEIIQTQSTDEKERLNISDERNFLYDQQFIFEQIIFYLKKIQSND